MGMDLSPIKISDGYRDARLATEEERLKWPGVQRIVGPLMLGWLSWRSLIDHLDEWGVNVSEFTYFNDGDRICAQTCAQVADAIEMHLWQFDGEEREWLEKQIPYWRYCGGFKQW